jgi:metallo-beta-lactamase class B
MTRIKRLVGALAAMAAGALSFAGGPAPGSGLAPEYAAMNGPMTPFRIADNLYYVGASDVTSFLIVTRDGYILIDGGFEQTAPAILDHIRALGFDPAKIRYILNSHAHFDHAGGIAAIRAATGAKFAASAADAPVLKEGGANDFALKGYLFPPAAPDRIVADGERVTLGGVSITAHITAGHTKGCTTWTLPLTVDGRRQTALFLCSLSVLSEYRLIGDPNYPGQADDFEKTFATLESLPCDVFLGSHGSFFDLKGKAAKLAAGATPNPFVDPRGCRAYVAKARAVFDTRLAACKADTACGKTAD